MSAELENLANRFQDSGYGSGASAIRDFARRAREEGILPVEFDWYDQNPLPRSRFPQGEQLELFDTVHSPSYEAEIEGYLKPVREEFEKYDPHTQVVFTGKRGQSTLSPQFAYNLRELVGGAADDNTQFSDIMKSNLVKEAFAPKEGTALSRSLWALQNDGMKTVGTFREARISRLSDVPDLGPRGIVFLQTAFRKT